MSGPESDAESPLAAAPVPVPELHWLDQELAKHPDDLRERAEVAIEFLHPTFHALADMTFHRKPPPAASAAATAAGGADAFAEVASVLAPAKPMVDTFTPAGGAFRLSAPEPLNRSFGSSSATAASTKASKPAPGAAGRRDNKPANRLSPLPQRNRPSTVPGTAVTVPPPAPVPAPALVTSSPHAASPSAGGSGGLVVATTGDALIASSSVYAKRALVFQFGTLPPPTPTSGGVAKPQSPFARQRSQPQLRASTANAALAALPQSPLHHSASAARLTLAQAQAQAEALLRSSLPPVVAAPQSPVSTLPPPRAVNRRATMLSTAMRTAFANPPPANTSAGATNTLASTSSSSALVAASVTTTTTTTTTTTIGTAGADSPPAGEDDSRRRTKRKSPDRTRSPLRPRDYFTSAVLPFAASTNASVGGGSGSGGSGSPQLAISSKIHSVPSRVQLSSPTAAATAAALARARMDQQHVLQQRFTRFQVRAIVRSLQPSAHVTHFSLLPADEADDSQSGALLPLTISVTETAPPPPPRPAPATADAALPVSVPVVTAAALPVESFVIRPSRTPTIEELTRIADGEADPTLPAADLFRTANAPAATAASGADASAKQLHFHSPALAQALKAHQLIHAPETVPAPVPAPVADAAAPASTAAATAAGDSGAAPAGGGGGGGLAETSSVRPLVSKTVTWMSRTDPRLVAERAAEHAERRTAQIERDRERAKRERSRIAEPRIVESPFASTSGVGMTSVPTSQPPARLSAAQTQRLHYQMARSGRTPPALPASPTPDSTKRVSSATRIRQSRQQPNGGDITSPAPAPAVVTSTSPVTAPAFTPGSDFVIRTETTPVFGLNASTSVGDLSGSGSGGGGGSAGGSGVRPVTASFNVKPPPPPKSGAERLSELHSLIRLHTAKPKPITNAGAASVRAGNYSNSLSFTRISAVVPSIENGGGDGGGRAKRRPKKNVSNAVGSGVDHITAAVQSREATALAIQFQSSRVVSTPAERRLRQFQSRQTARTEEIASGTFAVSKSTAADTELSGAGVGGGGGDESFDDDLDAGDEQKVPDSTTERTLAITEMPQPAASAHAPDENLTDSARFHLEADRLARTLKYPDDNDAGDADADAAGSDVSDGEAEVDGFGDRNERDERRRLRRNRNGSRSRSRSRSNSRSPERGNAPADAAHAPEPAPSDSAVAKPETEPAAAVAAPAVVTTPSPVARAKTKRSGGGRLPVHQLGVLPAAVSIVSTSDAATVEYSSLRPSVSSENFRSQIKHQLSHQHNKFRNSVQLQIGK